MAQDYDNNDYEKIIFKDVCPVELDENIKIELPFIVKAHAEVHDIKLECKGHTIEKDHCKHHNYKKFKVIQHMKLHIPIKFEAEVDVGKEHVEFELEEA